MPIGKVKWFNEQKGYGFIEQEEGKDIFVHYSGVSGDGFRTLMPDQKVEYEVSDSDKGPKAINVRVVE